MNLTKRQQRIHNHRCLQFDRSWISSCSDAVLRDIIASAAAGNHDGVLTWRPVGPTSAGLGLHLQAVAEEVVRRAAYSPGNKPPPAHFDPLL